jgi:hypothetical protein
MINGETVRAKLETRDNRIGTWLERGLNDSEILEQVYLTALGRTPTDREHDGLCTHVKRARDRRKSWEDVVWAILNSKEFLLRR